MSLGITAKKYFYIILIYIQFNLSYIGYLLIIDTPTSNLDITYFTI